MSFGVENNCKKTSKYKINNKYSAFSLIELSIVLIIMGLLVAGITGGASLIDNARLTSLKREVDDYIRDVFTFYARVGRLPGDVNNSGQFGRGSVGNGSTTGKYTEGSFLSPYDNINNINVIFAPFIELYLYGVSSFKPTTNASTLTKVYYLASGEPKRHNDREMAEEGGIPFSKIYKDFRYMYIHTPAVEVFMTELIIAKVKKTVDTAKKMDIKFDDGISTEGNIEAYCGNGVNETNYGQISYNDAEICKIVSFNFDIK
jgi:prepilin-type N-terminal cleavage/methylation domain-containing protein